MTTIEQDLNDFLLWVELETQFSFADECWYVDDEKFNDGLELYKHWKETHGKD